MYMGKYSDKDIYMSKIYMQAYEALLDIHNDDLGIIGRFIEKLFGTNKYAKIENKLKDWYSLTYNDAYYILEDSGNKDYIFDPYIKK